VVSKLKNSLFKILLKKAKTGKKRKATKENQQKKDKRLRDDINNTRLKKKNLSKGALGICKCN